MNAPYLQSHQDQCDVHHGIGILRNAPDGYVNTVFTSLNQSNKRPSKIFPNQIIDIP